MRCSLAGGVHEVKPCEEFERAGRPVDRVSPPICRRTAAVERPWVCSLEPCLFCRVIPALRAVRAGTSMQYS